LKVSVGVVKYGDMPSRQWYMSPHHEDWYYHTPRTTPSEDLSPKFLEATLDPPLRLLTLGLNSLGYTTLPSCSGHYKSEDELNEAYDHLVSDARMIRKSGLELTDVENGNILEVCDPAWYLPWDRGEFLRTAAGSGGKPEGYLGFNVPRSDGYKVGSAVESAVGDNKGCRYEVKRIPNGYIFELRVHTGKQKSQDAAWRDLGDSVMLNLSK
jgi:hypothetical protein